jgi:hypothetical protein
MGTINHKPKISAISFQDCAIQVHRTDWKNNITTPEAIVLYAGDSSPAEAEGFWLKQVKFTSG